jgi:segregation and condensation protein B
LANKKTTDTDEIDMSQFRMASTGLGVEPSDTALPDADGDREPQAQLGASAGQPIQGFHDFDADWDDLSPEDEELFVAVKRAPAASVEGGESDEESSVEGHSVAGKSYFPMQELLTLEAQVESVIFASPKAVKVGDILEIIGGETAGAKEIQDAIDGLLVFYEERGGGFKLEHVRGGGYQFRTAPAAAPLMEKIFASRPRPLSRAAQETLAIIAYRQPATRADIEFIRGVDAGSIIKNLLERDLIKCVGRKEDSGRPMVFGTTDEFLRVYQLDSLKDLPPLDSFQPSQDMVQAAVSRLAEEDEVDVAEFIDDQTDDEQVELLGDESEASNLAEEMSNAVLDSDDITGGAVAAGEEFPVDSEPFDSMPPDGIEPPI